MLNVAQCNNVKKYITSITNTFERIIFHVACPGGAFGAENSEKMSKSANFRQFQSYQSPQTL